MVSQAEALAAAAPADVPMIQNARTMTQPSARGGDNSVVGADSHHQVGALMSYKEEDLRTLAGKLLTVQDEERQRISRDLHDDVNQRLGALGLQLDALCKNLPSSPAMVRRRIRAIRRHVGMLSDDVREMAYRFHQTTVEDLGLAVALQRYVNDFVRRTGIKATFFRPQDMAPIPSHVSTCLYRIAQESLGNVAMHAKADQVTVVLSMQAATIRLAIRDNGIGLDPAASIKVSSGLGILSMRERARLLNGTLELSASPGEGTEVVVVLPLLPDGAEAP